MRLPNPTFCPLPIENLINRCFYENPSKRPNFEETKIFLEESFNQMMNESNRKSETYQNRIEQEVQYIQINKLKDDKMESRYKVIRKTNRQENMKHLSTQVVIEKEVNISPLMYASLTSSINSGNLNPKERNYIEKKCNENTTSDNTVDRKVHTCDSKSDKLVLRPNTLKRCQSLPLYCNVKQIEKSSSSKSIFTSKII